MYETTHRPYDIEECWALVDDEELGQSDVINQSRRYCIVSKVMCNHCEMVLTGPSIFVHLKER